MSAPTSPVPSKQAWVVTVDMGYGHQRAADPFRDIARDHIITANTDVVVSERERKDWRRFQHAYETLSRLSEIPLVGRGVWNFYDRFQRIADRYPWRDLSKPSTGTLYLDHIVRHGVGRGIAEHCRTTDIPLLTTFYVTAIAAGHAGLKKVFCVTTDTDLNRVWVAKNPKNSPVIYFAPTDAARRRLLQYGVPEEQVFLTGFPLPQENVDTARDDLRRRLARLDPRRQFIGRYREAIARETGEVGEREGILTVTYAVGGAGAQRQVAADILHSAAQFIKEGRLRLNLIAGVRAEVAAFFREEIARQKLEQELGRGVRVLLAPDKASYFRQFNAWLRDTDILWTKPSELVFFSALGIPILMTPPLGSHEEFNRDWLQMMGAGFMQQPPRYAGEWLVEWGEKGLLAEAAFDAYTKAPRHGTENIKALLFAADRAAVELKR
jgi:hypothetical protein